MGEAIRCELCGREIGPQGHYVVRIEVFADPAMPAMTQEEIDEGDFDQAMKELLEQMQGMTEEELQDQVHRKFEFRICGRCQVRFLANPLGRPRGKEVIEPRRHGGTEEKKRR